MSEPPSSLSANHLQHLREQFATSLSRKVAELTAAWQRWQSSADEEVLSELEALAHKLAGSSGSHGFEQLGATSKQLETAALGLRTDPTGQELKEQAEKCLVQIRDLVAGLARTHDRILVIDDDPDMRSLLRGLLEPYGYVVSEAESGYTGLKLARSQKPDLILLDAKMPAMDGYETCFHLQQDPSTALIPVVFVTALEDKRDKAQALQVGASEFLVKPVVETLLLQTIQRGMARSGRWQALSDPPDSATGLGEGGMPDFSQFKLFLADQLGGDEGMHQLLQLATPESLYADCRALGVGFDGVARRMATFAGLPYFSVLKAEQVKLGVFPVAFSRSHLVVALESAETATLIAVSNLFNRPLFELLKRSFGTNQLQLAVAPPEAIWKILADRTDFPDPTDVSESVGQPPIESGEAQPPLAPVVQMVHDLIEQGYQAGASDIHIEPREDAVIVRYRVDGRLSEVKQITPRTLIAPMVARIKIMAGMDISERRLPQDGRIVFREFCREGSDFDLRVASAPMNFGEKVVLRIIDKQKSVLPLERLGFSPETLQHYRTKIRSPYGMILHVGPTGSGKSMTLYAALNEINTGEKNIQTAEDPIEYTLPGLNQMQVNPQIGLTFARALRGYLRQDPDVILVGEIRDRETAQIAIEASMTGHLLLSTLHTNDAASTVTRLVEMGIEPFMVSAGLLMICAQRLVRRLCPECREPYVAPESERLLLKIDSAHAPTLFRARGCAACGGLGYKGRVGVNELLIPDEAFRHLINQPRVTAERLKEAAITQLGMQTLFQHAATKVLDGTTSLAEVLESVQPD